MQSFIGLGGNIGTVADTFESALDSLEAYQAIHIRRVSSYFHTPAMGEEAGAPYLNAIAELEADCSALELLEALQAVETGHGRSRSTHWGPRTLDLDLLFYGNTVLDHPRLILPHPGCWYRRFVLDPLAEIAPDVRHPVKAATIKELRDRLLERPLTVGVSGGDPIERRQLVEEFSKTQSAILATSWTREDAVPALLFWLGPGDEQGLDFEDLPPLPRLDLTRFPEDCRVAARHVLTAALGPCIQSNGVL